MSVAKGWYAYSAPGTWPDCDMIPLGRIAIRGERGKDRMTRLKKEEQVSLMTFFTIFRSPLMFGGDLPSNDSFTLSLLNNTDILNMHKYGSEVRQLFMENGKVAITSRNSKTGERYLALFNMGDKEVATLSVNLKEFGFSGKYKAKELWTGESFKGSDSNFSQQIAPHASMVFSITK
ncbi:hypothetical protein WG904_14730 [Pedobacter sp. Du54]|uniref:alpha-galactosidase n=1 Tax=Pedobacter anseongensis TaxID=3133439 RepID=UPI0030959FB3